MPVNRTESFHLIHKKLFAIFRTVNRHLFYGFPRGKAKKEGTLSRAFSSV